MQSLGLSLLVQMTPLFWFVLGKRDIAEVILTREPLFRFPSGGHCGRRDVKRLHSLDVRATLRVAVSPDYPRQG